MRVCGGQALKDGHQKELPDIWLTNGNPWEIPRPETTYKIGFYGSVDNHKWTPAEQVGCSWPSRSCCWKPGCMCAPEWATRSNDSTAACG